MLGIFWNRSEGRLRAGWRIFWMLLLTMAVAITLVVVGWILGLPIDDDAIGLLIVIQSVAPVAAILVCSRLLDRRRLRDLGLGIDRAWWMDLLAGLVIGAVAISGVFLFEFAMGWARVTDQFVTGNPDASPGLAVLQGVLLFVAVGVSEELAARGYLMRNLAEGLRFNSLGRRFALAGAFFIGGFAFYAFHLGNPNFTAYSHYNFLLASVLLAVPVLLTGQLALPIGLHITWNLFQGVVFGTPVSGQEVPMAIVVTEVTGPERWTGGAFGVEGGLLGIVANVSCIAATLAWIRVQRGELRMHYNWTEYAPRHTEEPPDTAPPEQDAAESDEGESEEPIQSNGGE